VSQPLVYRPEEASTLRDSEVVAPSPQDRRKGLGYHLYAPGSSSLGQLSQLLAEPLPTLLGYLNPTAWN